jgi:hypothetical protein
MTETANAAKSQDCQYCGMIHVSGGICPMVKAFEYYPDGTLKRVEFKSPDQQWVPSYYPPQFPWRGYEIT